MSTSRAFELFQAKVLAALSALEERHCLRTLPTHTQTAAKVNAENVWLDLTHNDYLGIGHDEEYQARVRAILADLPLSVGAGASRLLGGEHAIFSQVEARFSQFKGCESSLYFVSGYAANESVGMALGSLGVSVFSDELNHASIIDGLKLGGFKRDQNLFIYRHNDLEDLAVNLSCCDAEIKVVFTESLFSMDGDLADLPALQALAAKYDAMLVVDEAHALGVYGPRGRGLGAALAIGEEHLISINPCGKAMAVQGAFVCGPKWFRDYLINKGRTFIFSTGPSPLLAAALLESISHVEKLEARREYLCAISRNVREAALRRGVNIGLSTSHIVPLLCGSEEKALACAEGFLSRNILAKAIRPPTVPSGGSRVRLSLHAGLNASQVERIIETVGFVQDNLCVSK